MILRKYIRPNHLTDKYLDLFIQFYKCIINIIRKTQGAQGNKNILVMMLIFDPEGSPDYLRTFLVYMESTNVR